MYNKLVLDNKWEAFTVKFAGQEHLVPSGQFEAEETLGNFIHWQATKWKLNVNVISRPQPPTVQKIKEQQIKTLEPEVQEETEKVFESDIVEEKSVNKKSKK